MKSREFLSKSPTQTKNIGRNLAKSMNPGDILALYGDLGAGKTTFIQGLAAGLGYPHRVFSPTFIFVRPYDLPKNDKHISAIYHIDLYRVESGVDLQTIGLSEFLTDPRAVSVIEWPEKIEGKLPKKVRRVEIRKVGASKRQIRLIG